MSPRDPRYTAPDAPRENGRREDDLRILERNADRNMQIRRLASDLAGELRRVDSLEDVTFAALDTLSVELPDNPKAAERLQSLPSCDDCKRLDGVKIATALERDESVRWVTRCPTCERFASDEAAALHLGRGEGYAIGWAPMPNGDGQPRPYVAMDPREAREARGERGYQWGADFLPGDMLDIAQHVGETLNQFALRCRNLDIIESPEGDRWPVSVTQLRIGEGLWDIEPAD
jgi:hypothetical protein